jgi:hypothetical protein
MDLCFSRTSKLLSLSGVDTQKQYHKEEPVPGSEIPPSRPIFTSNPVIPPCLIPISRSRLFSNTVQRIMMEHGNDIKYNLNTLEYTIQQSLKYWINDSKSARFLWKQQSSTCKSWGIDGGQMFHIILENSKFRAHKPMTTDQLTYSCKFCSFIPLIVGFSHFVLQTGNWCPNTRLGCQFPVRNTKWLKNGKLRKAILSAFYNISQRNFGILLILWCSFKLWWNFCLDQYLVYNANGPLWCSNEVTHRHRFMFACLLQPWYLFKNSMSLCLASEMNNWYFHLQSNASRAKCQRLRHIMSRRSQCRIRDLTILGRQRDGQNKLLQINGSKDI